MNNYPEISFFVQAQQGAMASRVAAAKSKLEQAYQHFLDVPPTHNPDLGIYLQLSESEMIALVKAAVGDIQTMGQDYCEAAVQLGWLESTSDWYRGAPGLAHKLAKEGRLVQFYGLLKYLKTVPSKYSR